MASQSQSRAHSLCAGSVRNFSTQPAVNTSKDNLETSIADDDKKEQIDNAAQVVLEQTERLSLEEIMSHVDMDELKKFNPKLHQQIEANPEVLLQVQDSIIQTEQATDEIVASLALQAAAESAQAPVPKVYTLPFIWAWGAPAFAATSAFLIKCQAASGIPWLPFIMMCGFGVRIVLAPMMIRQITLINKISQASPSFRMALKLFKHSQLPIHKRIWHTSSALYDYAKQTKTNLLAFYFYNIIQIPVFIVMVLSIRKLSFENSDLTGAGALWFPNLNEPDPYLILPLLATALNYVNLGRGITKENEHWYVNRFRSFFQVLQFFHLPFTHQWPAGAFIYWIASSSFVMAQQTVTKSPWFLQKVNPHFFYDYAKMYRERSSMDHENYVDRLLNAEDKNLKPYTNNQFVQEELQHEIQKFMQFSRMKKLTTQIDKQKQAAKDTVTLK